MDRVTIGIKLLSLTLLLGVACGAGPSTPTPEDKGQVRGRIVEVIARSITEVDTLRIRDEDGKIWTFTTEGFAGFTPSHLREHQLFGQSVLVSFVKQGDKLVALDIAD